MESSEARIVSATGHVSTCRHKSVEFGETIVKGKIRFVER
jgi:hypothetical protein